MKPQKNLAVKQMAASYRLYFEKFGGVRQLYLIDIKGRSVTKTKPAVSFGEYFVFVFILVNVVLHIPLPSSDPLMTVLLFAYLIIMAYAVKLLIHGRKTKKEIYETGQSRALHYEPKDLWSKNFPTKGERGELITALLAARRLCLILENNTSIPLGMSSRDSYFSYLIEEITNSREDDIHDYLYHEANHLCETALSYGEMYAPIIGLNSIPADWT